MITMIVAKTNNNVIGVHNKLPWKKLSADMTHFVKHTTGKTIVMGSNTFKSINEKPLPNRQNIIVTTRPDKYKDRKDIQVCTDLRDIKNKYKDPNEEIVIIGGSSLYKALLPYTSKIYLTNVGVDYLVDSGTGAYFPELNKKYWRWNKTHDHNKDENNDYDMTFYIVKKKNPNILFY